MDFESEERKAAVEAAKARGNVLGTFVAAVRSTEEVDERAASTANQELGHVIDRLVEPAPVTNSFKMFITNAVRRAHAYETAVDEAVAPDRLGLQAGDGIFDPNQAQDIEARVLRGAVADAMERFFIVPETEAGEEFDPLLVGRPKDYIDTMFTLAVWEDDYEGRYDDEPFAGMEAAAFWAAARRALIQPGIESSDEFEP